MKSSQNKLPEKIEGEKIYLRPVKMEDATPEYVGWLNDPEVNRFLEIRFRKHTLASLRKDLKEILQNPDNVFLAIIRKDTGKHIGNIKLLINRPHSFAEIGLMIGDKSSWGKGFASEAVNLLTNFAFRKLKLHKVFAGAYANNIGSIKAFLRTGFSEAGRPKKQFLSDGKYVDHILLEKINE